MITLLLQIHTRLLMTGHTSVYHATEYMIIILLLIALNLVQVLSFRSSKCQASIFHFFIAKYLGGQKNPFQNMKMPYFSSLFHLTFSYLNISSVVEQRSVCFGMESQ
jgi:hypothetical protein